MHLFWLILPWLASLALAGLWWRTWLQHRRLHSSTVQVRDELAQASITLTRIRQAVESSSDAIGIGDMESNSLYHNRAHLALFGYTVEELNAVTEPAALFADKAVAREIHESIRAGRSWAGETDLRTKDGRIVPALARADLILDDHKRPVGIFGVFTDITERRRVERLVEENRQRLELTLQSIGDAVITTDRNGRIVLMNPVAERFTGWTQTRAAGQPLATVLTLLDEHTRAPRTSGVNQRLLTPDKAPSDDTYLLVRPDGEERLVAENAAVIRIPGESGGAAGTVLVLRDITRERRQADEAARTNKLESLGLMAGGVAHDFGNLLTVIIGNVALAQQTPGLPDFVLLRLMEVEKAVWRAKDVTQQLMTFARGGTPVKKAVALPPLIREAVEFAVQNSGVVSQIRCTPDLWEVEADAGQLVQVINNLALNAVQAMPHGGTLTVVAENVGPEAESHSPELPGQWVRIAVTDSGTGISPENLAKIFDPFFTTKAKGNGLGLATSYATIKRHGGRIRVESAVGRGTTFFLLLPATAVQAGASAEPANPAGKKYLGRILLMDDERSVRESVALMLGLLNYEVVEAADGAEAVAKYEAGCQTGRNCHAVLLDLRVPEGVGGAETARRLRALDPALRAIAASGYQDDPVMQRFKTHGFDAALAKPFGMDDLADTLKRLLAP